MSIDEIKRLYNIVGLHALRENEIVKLINDIILERDNALAQNAELVASSAAMKDALDKIANWNECTSEFRINYGSNGERDFYRRVAAETLSKTPTQHLRDIQAEAVRDFIEFMYKSKDCQLCEKSLDAATQYAERLRRGEV